MEKETRNTLQRATQAARRLLEKEFREQLEGIYDILPDGTILSEPGAHLDERQRLVREKIVSAIRHKRAGGMSPQEAVADAVREAAFTALNRFAALKMLEARILIQPCISSGDQSSGFKEFIGLAPGLTTLPDKGYRLYLECLFDEIGCEVKVLFDRRDVASLLWPRRQALSNLIDILNDIALVSVWEADETIGWIYQYFNGEDERRKMREASQAPRNSYELAVRNQFFTPRYVVEFLTDNTLGRIWYEMMQGKTRIVDRCAYLVRRPAEIFLKDGENPPAQDHPAVLSHAELLKQPVYIRFRKKKDPRDIRVLDPAGGSGHFLLYGFDLFLVIYEEAWHDNVAPVSEITGQSLRADFPTIGDLRLAIPGLILRYNLHGIDIDPRAAQIASLAIWMRAQRAYSDYGIPRDIRPAIRKTNFVVAEPMPGEQELLKEFIDDLNPKVLGELVQVVFKKMELAGEAGSLLKIEEDIHDTVAEYKDIWQREYMRAVDKHGREMLFSEREMGRTSATQPGLFDVSDTDEQFWDKAENLLIEALHSYAKRAANGKGYQRRLFVEDAEHGFAFIDLCRKRYDVVLMNPPFGGIVSTVSSYVASSYPSTKNDVYAAFVERALNMLFDHGMVGAITSRTGFFLSSLELFRSLITRTSTLRCMADLGQGVLDSAMVKTASYVIEKGQNVDFLSTYFLLLNSEDKNATLLQALESLENSDITHFASLREFSSLPGTPFAYWAPKRFQELARSCTPLEAEGREVRQGLASSDDFRFIRAWWEVPAAYVGRNERWVPFAKGGESTAYFADVHLLIDWKNEGASIKSLAASKWGSASRTIKSTDRYFCRGITYTSYTNLGFHPRVLPKGCIFSVAGMHIHSPSENLWYVLGILSSRVTKAFLSLITDGRKFEAGYVKRVPYINAIHEHANGEKDSVSALAKEACRATRQLFSFQETVHDFCSPGLFSDSFCAIAEGCARQAQILQTAYRSLKRASDHLDELICRIYEVEPRDIADCLAISTQAAADDPSEREENDGAETTDFGSSSVSQLMSWLAGVCYGRWDIRIALDPSLAPKLQDPFEPLPVCPSGILVGPDGLPAKPGCIVSEEWLRARPDANTLPPAGTISKETIPDSEYPLDICWNGILVDDPGHPDDIITRIRQVFDVIWQERAHEIYAEAVEMLDPGKDDLRPWFRANFFADHIKRYSKSRRKAPIYWCLSTPSRSYAVWLYYHRFNKDTFYKVLNDCVKPKLQLEERKLATLRVEIGTSSTSAQRKQLADQEKFVAELKTFHDEVAFTAPLWKPDLNDGVIINFAPLWRLAPQPSSWQKECKQTWDALVRGDYDWAHLAMHLWPERVVPKCHKDRSLTIAHGLDESLWEEDEDYKWKPRDLSVSELKDLVAARSSRSVKDALERLLAAPGTAGNGGRRRRG